MTLKKNSLWKTLWKKKKIIKALGDSRSLYNNYKGYFSIILLGVVDADYKFLWAEIGGNGSLSDFAMFNQSDLKPAAEAGTLNLQADYLLVTSNFSDSHNVFYPFQGKFQILSHIYFKVC